MTRRLVPISVAATCGTLTLGLVGLTGAVAVAGEFGHDGQHV